MVDAKLIQSNAYSLWLDDLESNTGSILFGGVDTAKYIGSLQTLFIRREQGQHVESIKSISGVSLIQNGKEQTFTTILPTAAILDSASNLTYLPNDLTNSIYGPLDVQYSQSEGNAFCNCNLANENTTLESTFTPPTISIPIKELVIDTNSDTSQAVISHNKRQQFNSGISLCLFGIVPSEGSTAVLGDTFLKSAYVVYDLVNRQISLAQTKFD